MIQPKVTNQSRHHCRPSPSTNRLALRRRPFPSRHAHYEADWSAVSSCVKDQSLSLTRCVLGDRARTHLHPSTHSCKKVNPRRSSSYRLLWLLFLLLLPLAVIMPAANASPWIVEKPKHIQFNVPSCRPVSEEDLRRQMGAAWDPSRMATDMNSAKMLADSANSAEEDSSDDALSGYQGDDPSAAYVTERTELVEDELILDEDGNIVEEEEVDEELDWGERYSNNANKDDDEDVGNDDEIIEKVSERLQAARIERPLKHPFLRDIHSSNDLIAKAVQERQTRRIRHPRRRRRRSVRDFDPKSTGSDDDYEDDDDDRSSPDALDGQSSEQSKRRKTMRDRKLTNSALAVRLFLSGKNKNLRRQLKKKFRQNAKHLKKKEPPWQCKLDKTTLFMKEGIFPRVLIDGRCQSTKCFYRLYNCEPAKYAIKLLQRDPDYCNPLPAIGNSTVYEERWNLLTYHVTVGCNCASMSGGKRHSKSRRRD